MKLLIQVILALISIHVWCDDLSLPRVKEVLIQSHPEYFTKNDDYFIIGSISAKSEEYLLVYTSHYWKDRATNRLVILNMKLVYIGNYGQINVKPSKIVNRSIVKFIFDDGDDNDSIDFSAGIPRKIFLDGESYTLSQ